MQAMISIGSISHAMRAKQVLEQQGIRAFVRRTTEIDDEYGCGYSLLIPSYTPTVGTMLRNAGVKIRRIKGRDTL